MSLLVVHIITLIILEGCTILHKSPVETRCFKLVDSPVYKEDIKPHLFKHAVLPLRGSRSGVPHQITHLSGTFKALWKSAVTEQYTWSWSWLIQAGCWATAVPSNVKPAFSVNPLKPRGWNRRAACQVSLRMTWCSAHFLIRKFVLTNLSGHAADATASPCLSWWLCLLIATPETDSVPRQLV